MSACNKECDQTLSEEIKHLKIQCEQAVLDILDIERLDGLHNSPVDYLEKNIYGLVQQIENTEAEIITNENLLLNEFTLDTKNKIKQIKELITFTDSALNDLKAEYNRLKTQLDIIKTVKTQVKLQVKEVKQEHLEKAQMDFKTLKAELHGLIHSLIPHSAQEIIAVLGKMIYDKVMNGTSEYSTIDEENYHVMELLINLKIVVKHPYDNTQFKMLYS